MLRLNPPTLHCGSAITSGRELLSFLLSFSKVLGLILFKDCVEELVFPCTEESYLRRPPK